MLYPFLVRLYEKVKISGHQAGTVVWLAYSGMLFKHNDRKPGFL
jgi:hypothetical protein